MTGEAWKHAHQLGSESMRAHQTRAKMAPITALRQGLPMVFAAFAMRLHGPGRYMLDELSFACTSGQKTCLSFSPGEIPEAASVTALLADLVTSHGDTIQMSAVSCCICNVQILAEQGLAKHLQAITA